MLVRCCAQLLATGWFFSSEPSQLPSPNENRSKIVEVFDVRDCWLAQSVGLRGSRGVLCVFCLCVFVFVFVCVSFGGGLKGGGKNLVIVFFCVCVCLSVCVKKGLPRRSCCKLCFALLLINCLKEMPASCGVCEPMQTALSLDGDTHAVAIGTSSA